MMRYLLIVAMLAGTAWGGEIITPYTWERIKGDIESMPDGGKYKLPVGTFYATSAILISGNNKDIYGNVIFDNGRGIPRWGTPKLYTIIVLTPGVYAFELMNNAKNIIINLQVDQELYEDYKWPSAGGEDTR